MSTINGTSSDDILSGTPGNDAISGAAGNDLIDGGAGRDFIDGGAGTDTVVLGGTDFYLWLKPDGGPGGSITLPYDGNGHFVTVTNVEYAQFLNETIALFGPYLRTWTMLVRPPTRQLKLLSDIIRFESDLSGLPITQYQLYDDNNDPNSGHFVVNGVVQAAGAVITVTTAEAAQTYFVVGTVDDNLKIRAFDGTYWSAPDAGPWAPVWVPVGNAHFPGMDVSNVTATPGQALAASSLISVYDPDGDPFVLYEFIDESPDPASGHFVVNGVVQAAETIIQLTPAELAQTVFVAGNELDLIQVRGFAGGQWTAQPTYDWNNFYVVPPNPSVNHLPVVATSHVRTAANVTIPFSNLFSVSDADGDTITRYQFWGSGPDLTYGHFVVNGVPQLRGGQTLELTAALAAQTVFVTGSQDNEIQVRVFDGTSWSAPISGPSAWFEYGPSVNNFPLVTPLSTVVTANTVLPLSGLFSVSDADGDAMTRYQVRDTIAGGYFVVNGVAQPNGSLLDITPSQLAQTSFVASAGGDAIRLRAFDGFDWSDNGLWSFIGVGGNTPPTLYTGERWELRGQILPLSDLIFPADPDGGGLAGMTKYQLLDTTSNPKSGYFVISGVTQPAGTVIDITASQVAQTSFVAGTAIGDDLQIRAFDGVDWSAPDAGLWSPFTVAIFSAPPRSDFDADGKFDLVWQSDSGQVQVWLMNGTTVQSTAIVASNPGPSWHVKGTGDFNGDGYADILWQNDNAQAAIWFMNGTSVAGSALVGSNPVASWHIKGAGDFDGDGKSDILWQLDSGQVMLWLMNGSTIAGIPPIGSNPGPSWHVKGSGDFNGDGKSDIVWQNDSGQAAIWLIDNTTLFSGGAPGGGLAGANPGPSWHVAGAGDFDGDLKSDLLWQNDSGQVAIWLMNGSTVIGGGAISTNPGPSWQVKGTADLDGDGLSDILWQSASGQAMGWLMNGTTIASNALLGSNPGPNWQVANYGTLARKTPGDFDGDHSADILWQNDSGQAAVWLMNGSNVVGGGGVSPTPSPSWHVKGTGDFDNDGKSDLLWQNDNGQAAVWLMNGPSLAGGGTISNNPDPSWHVITARDFDSDGKSDIVWQNNNGQVAIWFMNGASLAGGAVLSTSPDPSWHIKAAADFDGDGKSDLLWQNDSGQAAIWLMNGTSITGSALVGGNPGTSWHVMGSGDFNGDGKSDMLWQNDNGQAHIWLMNGTQASSTADIGANPGASWRVKGTADINSDGLSDILWQNTSGQATAWMMSGTSVLSTANIGSNPGTTWHLIAGN